MMEGLLKQAGERVIEINRQMSLIEGIAKNLGMIDADAEPAYVAGSIVVKLDSLITQEQAGRIREAMKNEIEACMQVHADELAALIGVSVEEKPKNPVTVPAGIKSRRHNLNYEKVRSMYEDEGMNLEDIATHYGCVTSVVSKFMSRNGIKTRPKGGNKRAVKPVTVDSIIDEQSHELTPEAVRAVYTDGIVSLSEAAKHFGVSSTELYAFIEKHGLKKVPKKDKIFKDAGKAKP